MSDNLKVVKCEYPLTKEDVDELAQEMLDKRTFLIIYWNNGYPSFHQVNMNAAESISSLDMVKFKIMTEHLA